MSHIFNEWLEELPLQTLTDELKSEILQKYKEDCENTYSEQDVKLLLYAFRNAFDKPCYTTQMSIDRENKPVLRIESMFPFKSFYKQYLKPKL
jgi:hypothetical protein